MNRKSMKGMKSVKDCVTCCFNHLVLPLPFFMSFMPFMLFLSGFSESVPQTESRRNAISVATSHTTPITNPAITSLGQCTPR